MSWTPRSRSRSRRPGALLIDGLERSLPRRRREGRGPPRHALHGPDARCPRRADDLRAEARWMGVRARARPRPDRACARGPARGQALGRRRPVRGDRPGGRARSPASDLGLEPAPSSTQILQRDRHAELLSAIALVGSSLERFAVEIRHLARTEVREVEEPFAQGPEGLVGDAAQAEPDRRRADLRARARLARERAGRPRERRALARAGHLPLVGRAHRAAGLVPRARLRARPLRLARRGPRRAPGAHASERRLEPRAVLQPAACCSPSSRAASRGTSATGSCSDMRCARGRRSSTSRSSCAQTTEVSARVDLDEVFDLGAYTVARRHHLRSAALARRPRAMPSMPEATTSRAGRSARSTRSVTRSCSSSPPTASRPSTSCSRPRSPTRAGCSPASRRSGSRARATSSDNHLLAVRPDGRSLECRRLEMLPVEFVVRGYLAGSGWVEYRDTGAVCGHRPQARARRVRAASRADPHAGDEGDRGPRPQHHGGGGGGALRRRARTARLATRRSPCTGSPPIAPRSAA